MNLDRSSKNMMPSDVAMAVFEQQHQEEAEAFRTKHNYSVRDQSSAKKSDFSNPNTQPSNESGIVVDNNVKNRRKTAKEIAQMYENLKMKYIERKKEWAGEKKELR